MINSILKRAEILLHQERLDDAEEAIREGVSIDPTNPNVMILQSQLFFLRAEYEKSLEFIDNALVFAPNNSYIHYLRSRVFVPLDSYQEAENSIAEAINLSPNDAEYYAFWAYLKLERKQYNKALKLANKTLGIDAENLLGLNMRSQALLKLNRKDESSQTIEGALNEDPNNPYTHASYGWNLLEQGKHKEALNHFKESLEHDPNYVYAQSGMLEALKAKYIVYRLFLKYSFWMSNLTAKYQWGVIIGFYIVYNGLARIAGNNPRLEPFLTPLLIILLIVVLLSWFITPLSNLFLRINPFGRLLLDKNEKKGSNLIAICAIVSLLGVALFIVFQIDLWLLIAAYGLTMMIPMSVVYSPSKNRGVIRIYAGVMTVIGFLAILTSFNTGHFFNILSVGYIWGLVIFQFVANYFVIREGNK